MVRRVSCFYTGLRNESGEGIQCLSRLAAHGVDLAAVTAVPFSGDNTQFTFVPGDVERLTEAARAERIRLDGPHAAIMMHGPDRVGAVAASLGTLAAVGIRPVSVQGITDGRGGFAYLFYVKPCDVDRILAALGAHD